MTLAAASLNTTKAPSPGKTGGGDAPGSAAFCEWVGPSVKPTVPYFLHSAITLTVSIVPYRSGAEADSAFRDALRQSSGAGGATSVTGVGQGAFLASPGPQDDNAELEALSGRFVFTVAVTAIATVFDQKPWIAAGRVIASSLAPTNAFPVTVVPEEMVAGHPFSGQIAFFTYSGTAGSPAVFTARVDWGDGTTSVATVGAAVPDQAGLPPARAYIVTASHTYSSPRPNGTIEVDVATPAGEASRATAHVVVASRHPDASFIANPPAGVQNGISLMMPAPVLPGQEKIVTRRWRFLDDYNPVVDSPSTRPLYNQIISRLLSAPGSFGNRAAGILLGILPTDANGGVFGFGSLSDDNVRQIAAVWQAYWPSHIVPHLYDEYGQAGVGLTVTDASGHQSRFTRNITISRDCLKWGGPLSVLFGGYTVCDTYNGIATQFGPHRPADWASIDISDQLAHVGHALGFGGGVSLTITRAALSNPANGIFLSLHFDAGVGISLGGSLAIGWVGPPSPNNTPHPYTAINDFVNGMTVDGGFSLDGELGPVNLGLGFQAIYSPKATASGGEAGEQVFLTGSGASASVGVSCSWPLSGIPPSALDLLRKIIDDWSTAGSSISPGDVAQSAVAIVAALAKHSSGLYTAIPKALANCAP